MSKERFEFNNHILSEFSDYEVRKMAISLKNAIDTLYTLSDMAREVGDYYQARSFEETAFHLTYVIPNFNI